MGNRKEQPTAVRNERTNEKEKNIWEDRIKVKRQEQDQLLPDIFFSSSSSFLASTHFSRPVAFAFHSPHSKKKKKKDVGMGKTGTKPQQFVRPEKMTAKMKIKKGNCFLFYYYYFLSNG